MKNRLRSWLSSDTEDNPEDDPDTSEQYMLIRESPERGKIRSYDERVDPEYVKLNEDLEPGTYRLQEVVGNGRFGEVEWRMEYDVDKAEQALQEAQKAKQEAQRSREQARQSAAPTQSRTRREQSEAAFDDPMEKLAYEIVSESVQNPDIMAAKGDEIIDRAMSQAFAGGGPTMNYEIDSEFQALVHELRTDPRKAEQFVSLAENMTRRLGSAAIEGVTQEMEATGEDQRNSTDSTPASGLDEIAWPDADEVGRESEPRSTGGASSMDDLQREAESPSSNTDPDESGDADAGNRDRDRDEEESRCSEDSASDDDEPDLSPTLADNPSPEEIAEKL